MKPTNLLWLACAMAIPTVASAQVPASEIVLHNFQGEAFATAGVIQDPAGNLYGTTSGGTDSNGFVYKLDTTGHYTVLYSFTGGADGLGPSAGVIRDSAGNLYGTTAGGGAARLGTVYKLDSAGRETVLYSFIGGVDGLSPSTGVIQDSAGNLYGTTDSFDDPAGWGNVYTLDTTGHYTVLYSFTNGADGSFPSGVIRDSAGNLYGTANGGGTAGFGVVYTLDTTGHETVLYTFTGGTDGGEPFAGVIRDSAGNLYGTTVKGGTGYNGVIFKLDVTGHETVLYSFPLDGTGGIAPSGGLSRDSAGNLYGTTFQGGPAGNGVVYKLDTTGQYTVLYTFKGFHAGGGPNAGVILGPAGNLFGTAADYGKYGSGVLFAIEP